MSQRASVSTETVQLPLLADKSVILRRSGLAFSCAPSLRSWEQIGQQLLTFAESSTWWIADWLAYGEAAFQDRYREAIKRTSLSYQTLRNYAWVARQFELSRRRDTLSFCHHAEVAALERPEQDFWLRKADEFGWSRSQLRSEVRASLRERKTGLALTPDSVRDAPATSPARAEVVNGSTTPSSEILCLRLAADQVTLWTAAADAEHAQLGDWAIAVLDAAARSQRYDFLARGIPAQAQRGA